MVVTGERLIALRDMTAADLRAVRRIEAAAYGNARPRTPFERELSNGLAHYLVAIERAPRTSPSARSRRPGPFEALRRMLGRGDPGGDAIVGFVGLWFTVDQLHVVTIAVEPSRQGRGIAQRLLLACLDIAADSDMRSIALEVRASNARAQRLYEYFGFRPTGTLRRYYSDNGEDAVVMLADDLATPDGARRVAALRAEHAARYPDAFED